MYPISAFLKIMQYLLAQSSAKTPNASTRTSPHAVNHCYPVTPTARKYSHINETEYILEKCDYTFFPKPLLPYNLTTLESYLLSKKSLCSAHTKPTLFYPEVCDH